MYMPTECLPQNQLNSTDSFHRQPQNKQSVSSYWGQKSRFQEEGLHLVHYLSARDFIYPKILFHWFEEEIMLFQAKLVVLGKSVYPNAFLAFENSLNVELNSEISSNVLSLIKSWSI